MLLARTFTVSVATAWAALAPPAALAEHVAAAAPHLLAAEPIPLRKAEMTRKFLLQVSYEQRDPRWQDFMTSRSRVVTFERRGEVIQMIEDARDSGASSRPLATIPIRRETADALFLDFNVGFDRISNEEDRTGEDYYGRAEQREEISIELGQRSIVRVRRLDTMVVFEQLAYIRNEPVSVYYYLSPYRPNPHFKPFELQNLDHFGFYETYPQRESGRTHLYAMKFDSHEPIVFALSSAIPARFRNAVREGALYWNRALGRELIRVNDAPIGVSAPNARYNVLQWVVDRGFTSTSHIQADPLTGEILHAHVFLDARDLGGHETHRQQDRLRYLAAHEVGHALGLRHNFAGGSASVMNYFSFNGSVALSRKMSSSPQGLEYDRKVMRHVCLGEPLDLASLPAFCTDSQPGCGPLQRARDISAGKPTL